MRALVLATVIALAGCATAQHAISHAAPTFDLAPGEPALRAALYGDCISEANSAHSVDRQGGLIRFHCTGAPAQAFYNGLDTYSATIGSEYHANGLTWRFTQKLTRNPDGLDFCTRADADGAYACTLIFNAGGFAAQ